MPPHLLALFTKGLLMGKIFAACPITIPLRITNEDRQNVVVMEDINKAIKSSARTITKTKLSDRICSEDVLRKANLKCLNEAVASITAITVWKSKQSMDPLGQCLFHDKPKSRVTRLTTSKDIPQPVPGYPMLASNVMARVWNCIPDLRNAATLGAAKAISRKWAKTVPR